MLQVAGEVLSPAARGPGELDDVGTKAATLHSVGYTTRALLRVRETLDAPAVMQVYQRR